MPQMTLLH